MAQFDILSVEFQLPTSGGEAAQLSVTIDNPQNMELDESTVHSVPDDVELVPEGQSPTQAFWVYQNHYHLTITLKEGSGSNPLHISNTEYFNFGPEPNKFLDIVSAEKKDGKKKTRKVRRKVVGVATA